MKTLHVPAGAMGARACMAVLLVVCAMFPSVAAAQATAGRASSIVFPNVAKTGSFETEVFVRNPNSFAIDVDVLYYEAINQPSPGLKACTMLTIGPSSNVSFKLGTQCPVLATGGHFGMLVLRDHAAEKTNTFGAFSRVQHVITNQGFSIEGFPEHTFSGRISSVMGLKRVAASNPPTQAQPGYQPNCFVGALGEAVSVTIDVQNGADGSPIGSYSPSPIVLAPYQLFRILDIYGAVGGVGDKENIRVRFDNTSSPGEPAYLAFCTEQDNLSFGADFRIAKSDDEANITKLLTRCRGTSDSACTTLTAPATFSIPNATTKHRFSMFVHHPDYVHCDIVGPNAGFLEIQLLGPAPAGVAAGPVVAGGTNQSSFYYATGPRNAVVNSNGFQTFWNLEIGPREGGGAPPGFPVDYGFRCFSGSGIHASSIASPVTDDF
jgi:hypothetical protein